MEEPPPARWKTPGSIPTPSFMRDITGQKDLQKEDYQRFFVPDGKVDPNFSPARNKAIIEKSIKDYEALRARKAISQDDAFGERSDAIASYLFSKEVDSGGENSMKKYFGKRTLAYLRGMQIRDQLMASTVFKNKDGAIIVK